MDKVPALLYSFDVVFFSNVPLTALFRKHLRMMIKNRTALSAPSVAIWDVEKIIGVRSGVWTTRGWTQC